MMMKKKTNLFDFLKPYQAGQVRWVTPNQRLARVIENRWLENQKEKTVSWERLWILPWQAWLSHEWNRYELHCSINEYLPKLISDFQARCIWSDLIKQSSQQVSPLLDSWQLAVRAYDTYKLLRNWQVPIENWFGRAETEMWRNWYQDWQNYCQNKSIIVGADIVQYLGNTSFWFSELAPKAVVFCGFTEDTPELIALQQDLEKAGCKIQHCSLYEQSDESDTHINAHQFSSVEEEWRAIACWLENDLKQFSDSNRQIAVVVPDLVQQRAMIQFQLSERLASESCWQLSSDAAERNFNISAGRRFIDEGMISEALLILTLMDGSHSWTEWQRWMTATYFWPESVGFAQRSEWVYWFRLVHKADWNWYEWTTWLAQELQKHQSPHYVVFKKMITNIKTWRNHLFDSENLDEDLINENSDKTHDDFAVGTTITSPRNIQDEQASRRRNSIQDYFAPCATWIDWIETALIYLGWPGSRVLTSPEYQVWSRWNTELENFTHLILQKNYAYREIISLLRHYLSEQIFQPQSKTQRIQVLGLMEAAGLAFDAIWISGLNADVWPSPPNPNPFIPMDIQKKYNLPRSTAQRELGFAEQLWSEFQQATSELQVSFTLNDSDRLLYPSPIIAGLFDPENSENIEINDPKNIIQNAYDFVGQIPCWRFVIENLKALSTDAFPTEDSSAVQILMQHGFESITDDIGMPWTEARSFPQGASALRAQAACPFRGYSRTRLQLEAWPKWQRGFTVREKGTHLHAVLQHIWQELHDQEILKEMSDTALNELIEMCVQQVVKASPWSRALWVEAEQQRLIRVVKEWMVHEKQRPEFFEVERLEQSLTLKIGPLTFKVRPDRVDRIGESCMIIDYKSGRVSANVWKIPRPDEPQLLMYLTAAALNARAMGLFSLRRGGYELIGYHDENLPKPFAKSKGINWDKSMQEWKGALNELAEELAQGLARINPKSSQKTCKYCDYASLCRVQFSNQKN
ncbi:MAG: PD-(D/E)XK nuclease family protein [Pseudomonadota bacterium]